VPGFAIGWGVHHPVEHPWPAIPAATLQAGAESNVATTTRPSPRSAHSGEHLRSAHGREQDVAAITMSATG
jgi:hypothetical protein